MATATAGEDSRVCIYPCYLNSTVSASKGRKIPKDKAVENPTTPQIFDIVHKILKLPAEMQRNRHPKDWKYLGRVRVSLKDDNGSYIKEELSSRKALMMRVAELLPKHPSREGKEGGSGSSSQEPAAAGGVGSLPARKKPSGGKKKK